MLRRGLGLAGDKSSQQGPDKCPCRAADERAERLEYVDPLRGARGVGRPPCLDGAGQRVEEAEHQAYRPHHERRGEEGHAEGRGHA